MCTERRFAPRSVVNLLRGRFPVLTSSEVVPGIYQLAEGLDLYVLSALQPCLNGLALGFVRLGRVLCAGRDVAAGICHVAFAIQPVSLNAVIYECVQKLLALGGFNVALVVKGKLKAKLAELAHTVFLAQSFLHGARIVRVLSSLVKQLLRLHHISDTFCVILLLCHTFLLKNHFGVDERGSLLYNHRHILHGAVAERLKAPVC